VVGRIKQREIAAAYLFLLPTLAFLFVFYVVPTMMALFVSFTEYTIIQPPRWNRGVNYLKIFRSSAFLMSIRNTAAYSLIFIPGKIVLAYLVALGLTQFALRGRGAFLSAYYIPRMTSMVVASFIWLWMFQPDNGLLNRILEVLSLPKLQWIYSARLVIPSVSLVTIWKDYGHTAVIIVAGLQGIPAEMYEAARMDGANRWHTFWRITLPLLKPVTLLVLIKTFIESFRVFTQVYVMTKGGPANASTTIVHQIYVTGFDYLKLGQASAMSFVLLALLLIVFIPYYRMLREESGM
jgi:ABC-type sugar transport system permease subunit